MSLPAYLATLDVHQLGALLLRRPDVLVEPAPRTVAELAMRLNGVESLSLVMPRLNRDELVTARAVALVGESEPAVLAERVGSPQPQVQAVIDRLCCDGLAWQLDGRVGLVSRLAEHLTGGVERFRPVATISGQARVDHLMAAVSGLGGDPGGLRKPALRARLAELAADPAAVARSLARLSDRARRHLDMVISGEYLGWGFPGDIPEKELIRAGLLVDGPFHRSELPRETAVTIMLGDRDGLTGEPELPSVTGDPDDGRAGAEEALRAVTTLLDDAANRPVAALKKGGVGVRERRRIGQLGLPDPELWIDIACAAGLLAEGERGYVPTSAFDEWREADPGVRWARIVLAWLRLEPAPTSRETDDGEVPPPLPLDSAGGLIRRALLRAAADGRSVAAAGEHLDWFCPLHPYDPAGRDRKVTAAVHEAAQLGVVATDRLTTLGEHLVAFAERPDAAEELARRSAELLPVIRGLLVLQSDHTAVVSGQVSAAASRLLAEAATPESRGTATTWRFTPASIRAALDAGWSADELRTELAAVSDRPLPQPLDYLIGDVARRHGSVRIRGARACVTGAEAEITEIMNTRSLRTLHLSRLAPTVLASPFDPGTLLPKLRSAGFAPVHEDADGVVIVQKRDKTTAPSGPTVRTRAAVDAADLAARLLAAGEGPAPKSGTQVDLSWLAPQLNTAEVALLADALDQGLDVRIGYRNRNGNHTVRDIRPEALHGRWLHSWCHLRSAEREFAVAGIEWVGPSVSPP